MYVSVLAYIKRKNFLKPEIGFAYGQWLRLFPLMYVTWRSCVSQALMSGHLKRTEIVVVAQKETAATLKRLPPSKIEGNWLRMVATSHSKRGRASGG
jgi:hypothetical protein